MWYRAAQKIYKTNLIIQQEVSRSTINDGRFFTQNDGEQYLLSSFWGFTPNPKVFLGV
jgi:hypothetical protein